MEMTGFYILSGALLLIAIAGTLILHFIKKKREREEQDDVIAEDPS